MLSDRSPKAARSTERETSAGVLLCNLGTPDAPTPSALRRYLKEFLWDPRVIEMPRELWWLILHGFVLPFRPRRSAALYRKVWTESGSPILTITKRQAATLAAGLQARLGKQIPVMTAMRYGNPSIRKGIDELVAMGCRRILALPLYPQYSATTIGSTFDGVAAALTERRWVPEVRTVHGYHDHSGYIAALAASVTQAWATGPPAEKLLLSFHGIPRRYSEAGDPYRGQCLETASLLRRELGLTNESLLVSFQSRFGREEWLQPYTDETVRQLGTEGLASLDVLCPGFAADCLETLEEIDGENRAYFEQSGGGAFRYIPALNDRVEHVQMLADLCVQHLAGWIEPTD